MRTPLEFEQFCFSQFTLEGWRTRLTGATGDQGADVIAENGMVKVVIQCKSQATAVGNAAVQQVIAARAFYHADFALVVCRSSFTRAARALAKTAAVNLLLDADLREWARAHRSIGRSGPSRIEDVIIALNVHGFRVRSLGKGRYTVSTPNGIRHIGGDGALHIVAEDLLNTRPSGRRH